MNIKSPLEQVSSRIRQHIQIPILDKLVLEVMSKSRNVDHLYNNETKNLLKILPFAMLISAAILGLFFPYFYIVATYFIAWALIFGYRYKQMSDLFSTLSKLHLVKETITDAIKDRHAIFKNKVEDKEDQYFKYISVMYLVKNKSISGSDFFNLFSILARDLNHIPFKATKIFSFERNKHLNHEESTDELFKTLAEKDGVFETLECLIDKPKQEYSYKEQMQLIEKTISKSSGVSIDEAIGIEVNKSSKIPKPYVQNKSLFVDKKEITPNAINELNKETIADKKNINDGIVTGAIAFIAGEISAQERIDTEYQSKESDLDVNDENDPINGIVSQDVVELDKEKIKSPDASSANKDIAESENNNNQNISESFISENSRNQDDSDTDSFSLSDMDEIEDIDNFDLPEAEMSEDIPNHDDDLSDDILEAIEKWGEESN